LLQFDQVSGQLIPLPLLSSHRARNRPGEGATLSCLIIAVVVGIVIVIGAVALVENVLAGNSDGTPADASIHQYGTR
jgi:hypothetical protein